MNDTTLKIDAATKEKIYLALASEATLKFVQSVKDAQNTGTFEVMITTDDIDRAGEMIRTDAWDFTNYLKSPVVLWGHNYSEPPIGVCLSLEKVGNGIKATGKFAPTEFAQQIRTLYDLGMCKATSVGFIPTEQEGNVITKAELLEFSFVSVPANPYALSLRRSFELPQETAGLVMKSIISLLKEKKDAENPVEEKPVEVVPPVEEEKKGAVQDELTADQVMEQKMNNLEDVWEVFCALCDVYMNEKTPVTDFTKLLTETISILMKIADGTYADTDDDTMKSIVFTSIGKVKVVALESILVKEDSSEGNGEKTEPVVETPAETPAEKAVLQAREVIQDVSTILGERLFQLKQIAKSGKLY